MNKKIIVYSQNGPRRGVDYWFESNYNRYEIIKMFIKILDYGVIGSTTDFDSVSPESYSGSPTITGDLRYGNRISTDRCRLTNRTRGNKSNEFESLNLTNKVGTKQLSVTLLNSVITLKLIIWVRKKKNVRQLMTMEQFKYNQ